MSNVQEGPSIVLFAGSPTLKPGEAELHSLRDKLFGVKLEDVKKDWQRVSHQIGEMVASFRPKEPSGMGLKELEVSLAFTAEGRLAFVAEAGIEASVKLVFSRSDDG